MCPTEDQRLLAKLYECQEIILNLCEGNIRDEKYIVLSEVITYLEKKIINEQGFVGI